MFENVKTWKLKMLTCAIICACSWWFLFATSDRCCYCGSHIYLVFSYM